MADAFGGTAFGEIRREGIRYNKDRLTDSKKIPFKSTLDRPTTRTDLERIANEVSGMNKTPKPPLISKSLRGPPGTRQATRNTGLGDSQ